MKTERKIEDEIDIMNEVQVLVVTMDLDDPEMLLKRMNINTSFVIGNQAGYDDTVRYHWKNKEGLIVSRNEKGVGANRNITLNYATGDYCVIADDDMQLYDNYAEKVITAFKNNPEADVIIFNLDEKESERRVNYKTKKIGLFNYMNYGAARLAFKRSTISYNGIFFNTNFGGGTKHSAGEDSLFIRDCLIHGLKVFAIPDSIAFLDSQRESTWFKGYTQKYLYDKGIFLGIAHPKLATMFALYFTIKHKEYSSNTNNYLKTFRLICQGIKHVRKGIKA